MSNAPSTPRRRSHSPAAAAPAPGRARPAPRRAVPDQEPATLPELLRTRALLNPDDPAVVIGSATPGIVRQAMTYADLYGAARALSGNLTMYLEERERAPIVLDPGGLLPTAVFAALIAGLVAIPAPLTAFARDGELAEHLIRQCAPAAILTTRAARPLLEDSGRPMLLLDELTGGTPPQAPRRPLAADPAYVEHTRRGPAIGCRTVSHQHALTLLAGGNGRDPHTTGLLEPVYRSIPIRVEAAPPAAGTAA
jgi:hypothetical protein